MKRFQLYKELLWEILKSYSGFTEGTDEYDDIQDLNMLASYDLIISDIKGVGKYFDSEFEGAFLLSELKKMYPYKSFAAYTGSAYDPRITEFLSGILVIKKDYSIC